MSNQHKYIRDNIDRIHMKLVLELEKPVVAVKILLNMGVNMYILFCKIFKMIKYLQTKD